MSLKQFQALQTEIYDLYKCAPFDIKNPVEFINAYNTHYGYKFRADKNVYNTKLKKIVDLESYIIKLKNELIKTTLKTYFPLNFVADAVKDHMNSIIEKQKLAYIESITSPTADETADGTAEFKKLTEAFLGASRVRPGYDMECTALYTWLAQAKYKILNGFSDKLIPFVIHVYSDRKGLGKSFVARRLLKANAYTGVGQFSTKTSSKELLDHRNISLVEDNNIILLDDFEGIGEKDQEAWKSIVTDASQERRILGTSVTKQIQLNLAIMTVGNYEVHDMIYNEQRERRVIQVHVDGDTANDKKHLPAEIFEHIDYDLVWKAIDETQYNLVWDNFNDELIESQEHQTSHTWFQDFIDWMVDTGKPISAPIKLGQFYKEHYLAFCNDMHQQNYQQKVLAKKLRIHPDLFGYGDAKYYKGKAWSITFSPRKVKLVKATKTVDLADKLEKIKNA